LTRGFSAVAWLVENGSDGAPNNGIRPPQQIGHLRHNDRDSVTEKLFKSYPQKRERRRAIRLAIFALLQQDEYWWVRTALA
jgi:hypothetical protein